MHAGLFVFGTRTRTRELGIERSQVAAVETLFAEKNMTPNT